jgi:FkbM family methyltransferase
MRDIFSAATRSGAAAAGRTDRQAPVFTADEVITSLYRAVFDRAPDAEGLRTFEDLLRSGEADLTKVAEHFFNSDEHSLKMMGPSRLRDYTQFGELRQLLRVLISSGSEFQIVVDIGARGRDRSNSYNLMKDFGWKGVLVEANPFLVDSIRAEFDGLDYALVNCAVGDTPGTLPFHIGVNDDVSSLLAEHASAWGDIQRTVDVEVRRLADVLRDHEVPTSFGVLSLDIEGLDVRVLNDLIVNSDYRPTVVIIEASYDFTTKTLADAGLCEEVQSAYRLVGQTAANLILQRS